MPHVTNSGMLSPGYVEKHLVEDKIIHFGFPILVQAAIPMNHKVDFVSPEGTRQLSSL